jgi:peptidoglycan-associated lipoprotein
MKNIVAIGFLSFFCLLWSVDCEGARKTKKSEAKQHFDKQEYSLAIPAYETELKNKKITKTSQSQIEAQIGFCYYYLNKPREAAAWLKKSINKKYETADVYGIYGLALQKQEKYEEALASFQLCLKKDKKYPNVGLYIQSCEYAMAHTEPKAHLKMRSAKINTDGSEYGISPAGSEIFFSRAPTKGRDIDPRTGLGYTEIYSTLLEAGELVKPVKEKAFMKTYYNTGVFTFDTANNSMYMTMCDPKSGKCGIYRSKFNRKKWETPEPVFVNDKYDMAHPALAKKGTRLYFASNATGGKGRTDIWYVDKINETEWGEPVNAGDKINTAGREEFPFVEKDSILYFSSNGHNGFGGLDLFAISINYDGSLGDMINLGRPFNSGADDFNLITFGDNGLLISSRNLAKSDDIYIFAKADLPEPGRKEKPKPKPVEPEPEPEPVAVAPVTPTAPTAPPPEIIATIYFDFDKFIPHAEYRKQYEKFVAQMKSYPNATFEIAGFADTRGGTSFNKELSDKRAKYIAKRLTDRGISKDKVVTKGYGFDRPAVANARSEAEFQQNRRVEIRILKVSE